VHRCNLRLVLLGLPLFPIAFLFTVGHVRSPSTFACRHLAARPALCLVGFNRGGDRLQFSLFGRTFCATDGEHRLALREARASYQARGHRVEAARSALQVRTELGLGQGEDGGLGDDFEGHKMVIVTITFWAGSWRAELRVSSATETQRSLSVGGKLYDRDRFKLGDTVESAGAFILRQRGRTLGGKLAQALGVEQEPDGIYDTPEGELRPIGAVSRIEDHLDIELYPGEGVFDELWARSVYGGTLPRALRIGIRAEGESWQEDIKWDTGKHPRLPIMSVDFTVNHNFPSPSTDAT
jgi:hypothetical protein